ncbi:zinc-binding alcohol dehydrogenase family protein [Burkholderia cenocepacia]|uniref:zinc-binding alcohol dehydrogenase family protein n=1 Tax=Burkholderia cenocepacia TaxID=95486 RepID=UPI000A90E6A8|nr:zinc-binding alcohol dehydrogenase family protein [Burkholderia cenocepacia]
MLGWDAAGTVVAVGADVTLFRPGDEVFYAGSITRPGANSEFHAVDERIAALKPRTRRLRGRRRAAAHRADRVGSAVRPVARVAQGADAGKSVLIIAARAAWGSIAIQLAKTLGKLHVIATASRPASAEWVRALGADAVVDHFGDLPAQLREAGHPSVDHVLIFNDTDHHFPAAAEVIRPQGGICTIVENAKPVPVELLKAKSAAFHWEFMFTRAMFETPDMIEQHKILGEVARLVDAGTLRTTLGEQLGTINAANVRRAHQMLEGGRAIGKLVLSGF